MCVSRQPVTHPHTHAQTTIRICVRASTFSSFRMKKKQDTKRHFSLRGAQKEAAVQVFIGIANVATLLSHRGDFVPLFPLHTHTHKSSDLGEVVPTEPVCYSLNVGALYIHTYIHIYSCLSFSIFFFVFLGVLFSSPTLLLRSSMFISPFSPFLPLQRFVFFFLRCRGSSAT